MRRGFTLIELLIVIGILSVLATVVLMVLNPAQMMKESRDANRMAEIQSINKALLYFQGAGGTSMGSHNVVYVSLPSDQTDCSDLGLPSPGAGYTYACSNSTNYRKIDGTGWIPVDLTSIQNSLGNMFSNLPIDPVNTVANDYYYTYIVGSWTVSATIESTKFLAANAANDGGQSGTRFEVGNELALNANLGAGGEFSCGDSVSYDGKSYATVLIGSQCWFAENLNVGTMTAGSNSQGTDCPSTSAIEKYCYSDSEANCTSDGGLYLWDQVMCGSTSAGVQGICPTGWHIPTDAEFTTLIEGQSTPGCESSTGWQCSPAASHLSLYALSGDNSSGFSAILVGHRHPTNSPQFEYRTILIELWSSSVSGESTAMMRALYSTETNVYRDSYPRTSGYGFSVRCLQD